MARLILADKLIILTDTDGLFDKNPTEHADAQLLPVVKEITDEVLELAGGSGSNRGTGGMVTKLAAAKDATEQGIDTYILNGANPEDIYRLVDGHQIGTHFCAKE